MRYFIVFWSIALCTSCFTNDHKGEAEASDVALDKTYDRVLQVHDEIMPMMSDMNRLERELKKQLDSLDESLSGSYSAAIDSLTTAGDAMMDWMARFRPPSSLPDSLSAEEVKRLYRKQEEEIRAVGQRMQSAIKAASKLLEKAG